MRACPACGALGSRTREELAPRFYMCITTKRVEPAPDPPAATSPACGEHYMDSDIEPLQTILFGDAIPTWSWRGC